MLCGYGRLLYKNKNWRYDKTDDNSALIKKNIEIWTKHKKAIIQHYKEKNISVVHEKDEVVILRLNGKTIGYCEIAGWPFGSCALIEGFLVDGKYFNNFYTFIEKILKLSYHDMIKIKLVDDINLNKKEDLWKKLANYEKDKGHKEKGYIYMVKKI